VHAYTGCDTVSAFCGKGKVNALKIVKVNKEAQETFMQLGQEWSLTPELLDKLELFTCQLYAAKSKAAKVNDLRYHLFCAKKGEIESHQLPPCRDCMHKHAQRANFQAAIWKRSLQKDPGTPDPVGKGWKLETVDGVEELVIDWMDGQPAPQAVLDLLACTCPKSCKMPKCVCLSNGLRCTDMCRLPDCENQAPIEGDDEIVPEDDHLDDFD
jgi:hypothetical protein